MYPVHCVTHVSGPDPSRISGPGRIRTYDQRIMSSKKVELNDIMTSRDGLL
jgi:hypothetical protein